MEIILDSREKTWCHLTSWDMFQRAFQTICGAEMYDILNVFLANRPDIYVSGSMVIESICPDQKELLTFQQVERNITYLSTVIPRDIAKKIGSYISVDDDGSYERVHRHYYNKKRYTGVDLFVPGDDLVSCIYELNRILADRDLTTWMSSSGQGRTTIHVMKNRRIDTIHLYPMSQMNIEDVILTFDFDVCRIAYSYARQEVYSFQKTMHDLIHRQIDIDESNISNVDRILSYYEKKNFRIRYSEKYAPIVKQILELGKSVRGETLEVKDTPRTCPLYHHTQYAGDAYDQSDVDSFYYVTMTSYENKLLSTWFFNRDDNTTQYFCPEHANVYAIGVEMFRLQKLYRKENIPIKLCTRYESSYFEAPHNEIVDMILLMTTE